MLTPVKMRSSQGCWTCRLRHKKCDKRRGVGGCGVCKALEITCYFRNEKPDWMDGGPREKQMADDLKTMVKAKANQRRERKWALSIDGHDALLLNSMAASMSLDTSTDRNTGGSSRDSSDTPATSVTDGSNSQEQQQQQQPPSQTEPMMFGMTPFSPATTEIHQVTREGTLLTPFSTMSFPDVSAERELNFTIMYLDYVFPLIFPFYRPPLLEGGRGWVLVLLMKNKSLTQPGHDEVAIQSLQHDMHYQNQRGIASSFSDSLKCLESIVQSLSFEVAIANTKNWQVHLDVAFVLFGQIVQTYQTDADRPWYLLLQRMGLKQLTLIRLPRGRHPWTADQAALRLYTVNLLWNDIIAATALERAPRMQRYHAELLEGHEPPLCFEEVYGCEDWAMLRIGEIAVLDAWKKEMMSTSSLSMQELVQRAAVIERNIRDGIELLDAVPTGPMRDPSARPPDLPFAGLDVENLTEMDKLHTTPSLALYTRIWAQSALTYLLVVVSGHQPANPDIQACVAATMELFRALPGPLCLRTLAWPFDMTGCLAMPEQEQFCRDLLNSMGPMQIFGTVREALNIITAVWEHRACINYETWDVAASLGILGHRALLVRSGVG
ncbi:fungal-specific transcription factor domain-containing protein [Pseudomassariella vexata]|uniref:Fungal-specific transcription factor domain-domain-containing protein n=1 Tax=Pseudomassariella vexata TaxID=1141098 RepID=A0A1Y2DF54_9PEZI|nr:fungal-specific transcription factor domain-containing protein [Pseudomassariella vexata]ORY57756.1 fungal-specific transcription factor domain-domain-containing protein [Pseudomassariella vexata]